MTCRPLGSHLLLTVLLLLVAACAPPRESPQLQQETALRQAVLDWAILDRQPPGIDFSFPDGHMLSRYSTIVIQDDGSPASRRLQLPGRKVIILDTSAIRARADSEGDFLYLRFDRVDLREDEATVRLSLIWAISKATRESGRAPLACGGAEVLFRLEEQTWAAAQVLALWHS